MARKNTSGSWLDVIASLLNGDRKSGPGRRTRRLAAERLEGRMVLSVAPLDAADGGESLAEYLAMEQAMGPVVPAELAAMGDVTEVPEAFNQYFWMGGPEGEDCGEVGEGCGEGEGSGEGSSGGEGGTTTYTGSIGPETLESGFSTSLDGANGTVSVNENGDFVLLIDTPTEDTVITLTVTDSEGNTTTHTFNFTV